MCRNVQVERPSASTSAGQSGAGGAGESGPEAEAEAEAVEGWVAWLSVAAAAFFLVMANQEETEVQERQLWSW